MYTTRPVYKVVDGPAGMSVGHRMMIVCPNAATVVRAPGPGVEMDPEPFDRSDSRSSVVPLIARTMTSACGPR